MYSGSNLSSLIQACFLISTIVVHQTLSQRKCDWRRGDCLTDESTFKEMCEKNCSRIPYNCLYKVDRFGIDLKYQCHCINLGACDFDNSGHCNGTKCFFGYSGPTCQRRLYYESFAKAAKKYLESLRHRRAAVCQRLPRKIQFPHIFRINWVKFNISSSAGKPIDITSSMENQTLNCISSRNPPNCVGDSCYTTVSCTGDISSSWLKINGDNGCINNLEISGCPEELFGLDCTGKCRCKNGTTCHQITGQCKEGCEPGREGSWCQYQTYVNIAVGRPAFQSNDFKANFMDGENSCSSQYLATANFAVDDNYNQHFQHRSCSRTQTISGNAYWYVKLDRNYTISQIRIYSHVFIRYHLNVYVGDQNKPCSQLCYQSRSTDTILHIPCQHPLVGETVCIETAKKEAGLTLCEVEVLQCVDGFYGPLCQNRCDLCNKKKCDQFSGYCMFGCQDGYQWNNISKTCQEWSQNISTVTINMKRNNTCTRCHDQNDNSNSSKKGNNEESGSVTSKYYLIGLVIILAIILDVGAVVAVIVCNRKRIYQKYRRTNNGDHEMNLKKWF